MNNFGYPDFYNYRQKKHLQKYTIIWALIVITLTFGIFILCSCSNKDVVWAGEIKWDNFSDKQIVNAIFLAEGGYKAQYLYGIRSVPYKDEAEARRICFNTVRNNRRRYAEYGHKKYATYLEFLASRYCPTQGKNLTQRERNVNKYWLKNVKFFLING